LHLLSQGTDETCHLSSWRERQRGRKLVFVLDDEHIWKIYAAGLHGNQHLVGTWNRARYLLHV
jgi:hypothetical protein